VTESFDDLLVLAMTWRDMSRFDDSFNDSGTRPSIANRRVVSNDTSVGRFRLFIVMALAGRSIGGNELYSAMARSSRIGLSLASSGVEITPRRHARALPEHR
jgi:hypothetical protein